MLESLRSRAAGDPLPQVFQERGGEHVSILYEGAGRAVRRPRHRDQMSDAMTSYTGRVK